MGAWPGFWRTVVRIQSDKVRPWIGLRNAVGVILPLGVGIAAGSLAGGLAMATGALNVSYSDSDTPYGLRLRYLLSASVLVGFAVAAGSVAASNGLAGSILICLWAFAAGMLASLNPAISDMGIISLVTLLIWAATPLRPNSAAIAGLLASAGGLVQALVALAPLPLSRYGPERRALSNFFLEMSRTAAVPAPASESPPASSQSSQAQIYLASLIEDHSVEAERYQMLLSEAERMRLAVLLIARLRRRLEDSADASAEKDLLDRYLALAALAIAALGELLSDKAAVVPSDTLASLQKLREEARAIEEVRSTAILTEARKQMDAFLGQARAAAELVRDSTPEGRAIYLRKQENVSWRLKLAGARATLRANLNLHSAAFRHALRMAACVAAGDALARDYHLTRAYWLPMTIALVLKPDFTTTFSRGLLRLAGTFTGLAVATGLFHVLPASIGLRMLVLGLFVFVLRGYASSNYGLFTVAVTGVVVQMIAMAGVAPEEVIAARAWNTALGGLLALVAYAVWPTWERSQIGEILARMLDAYRLYFRKLRERYEHPEQEPSPDTERIRVSGRLARSNLEASFDRLSTEPGTSERALQALSRALASSHRMVRAMMALEAGLDAGEVAPAPGFSRFANQVELMLFLLAAKLRGSQLEHSDLPDLREAHRDIVATVGSETFLAVETDRITNSLNTLAEELLHWLALQKTSHFAEEAA